MERAFWHPAFAFCFRNTGSLLADRRKTGIVPCRNQAYGVRPQNIRSHDTVQDLSFYDPLFYVAGQATSRPAPRQRKRRAATLAISPGSRERQNNQCTRAQFCSKLNRMEYRGIRYTLRAGIERGKWFVAIYPEGVEMAGKKVFGTREDAESHAHHMIDRWLEPKSRQRSKLER
jgi:hypothetical protein